MSKNKITTRQQQSATVPQVTVKFRGSGQRKWTELKNVVSVKKCRDEGRYSRPFIYKVSCSWEDSKKPPKEFTEATRWRIEMHVSGETLRFEQFIGRFYPQPVLELSRSEVCMWDLHFVICDVEKLKTNWDAKSYRRDEDAT